MAWFRILLFHLLVFEDLFCPGRTLNIEHAVFVSYWFDAHLGFLFRYRYLFH